MKHTMKLLEDPFERIKDGTKTVEFRLYDEKRKMVQVGDIIEFYKLPDLTQKISTEVVELYRYPTFRELFQHLGYNEEEVLERVKSMHQIYSEEEEQKDGVLGIKIKKI